MSTARVAYTETRTILLERITTALKNDERFVSAWLAGSFGRGEQDWISDIDIHVVVADKYSSALCAQPWSGGARTTQERLELFRQFGEPSLVFDAHSNNQIGGTFTYVLYRESAINVDWMLIPQSMAHLENQTLMLFNKVELPEPPAEELPTREECVEQASLRAGFFWMIAAGCAGALVRGDIADFYVLSQWLENSIREVQAALKGRRAPFKRSSIHQISCARKEQAALLRTLCDEMEKLLPQVVEMGGYVPLEPRAVVELRLALLD